MVEENKEKTIKEKLGVMAFNVNAEIQRINETIQLCETDKGDLRYDTLHEVKNRFHSINKRLKAIKRLSGEEQP